MSIETDENILLEQRIEAALKASSIEAKETDVWYDFDEVAAEIRARLDNLLEEKNLKEDNSEII